MNRNNLRVIVCSSSMAWPGSRWCMPVDWSPRNELQGAKWDDRTCTWVDDQGACACLILLNSDHLPERQEVAVPADQLRVATYYGLLFLEA